MKAVRSLVALLALVSAGALAAEVETRTHTVSRIKGGLIYTESEAVFAADTRTKVVKKTAAGEVEAKLADIKAGDKIELQTEKGVEGIKKIVILK